MNTFFNALTAFGTLVAVGALWHSIWLGRKMAKERTPKLRIKLNKILHCCPPDTSAHHVEMEVVNTSSAPFTVKDIFVNMDGRLSKAVFEGIISLESSKPQLISFHLSDVWTFIMDGRYNAELVFVTDENELKIPIKKEDLMSAFREVSVNEVYP